MRILVCGGRKYNDYQTVKRTLNDINSKTPISLIIHGAASGADDLAGRWANEHGVKVSEHPADWKNINHSGAYVKRGREGKLYDSMAGFRRDIEMIELNPDLVVAFPGVSSHTKSLAKAAKIPILSISERPKDVA